MLPKLCSRQPAENCRPRLPTPLAEAGDSGAAEDVRCVGGGGGAGDIVAESIANEEADEEGQQKAEEALLPARRGALSTSTAEVPNLQK